MISIKCPHCRVGLKVDEGKLPQDITTFKCPKCKDEIPVTLLYEKKRSSTTEPETALINPANKSVGKLTVLASELNPEQVFSLYEGVILIGRRTNTSNTDISIETSDRSMSREHIRIEVKKDGKGGYKHYLSDNNSKNHTLYNSNYLKDGEEIILRNGDEIVLGRTTLRFSE